jgi:hypothetical protein
MYRCIDELCGPDSVSRYSDWLRARRSGDRIPVRARFSALVQTDPGAHSTSCTMGTRSFPWVNSGSRGVTPTPLLLLVPLSWKCRAIPLLPLWAVRPVQNLSACTRVHVLWTSCIINIRETIITVHPGGKPKCNRAVKMIMILRLYS